MKSNLALNARLLAIIGKRNPAIYDVIPRGPQGRLANAALNPQPLPPHELGAAIAADIIHAVWLANKFGHGIDQMLADLDEWCPTAPREIKLPPWVSYREPIPHPNWFIDFHLGFAERLAILSEDGTPLGKSLDKLIDRSLTAIEVALSS